MDQIIIAKPKKGTESSGSLLWLLGFACLLTWLFFLNKNERKQIPGTVTVNWRTDNMGIAGNTAFTNVSMPFQPGGPKTGRFPNHNSVVVSGANEREKEKDKSKKQQVVPQLLTTSANNLPFSEVAYALNEKPIPALAPGMTNVTDNDNGYNIKFRNSLPGKIAVRFDAGKIPAGYTVSDVYTYRYNSESTAWEQVPRDGIDFETNEIHSTATKDGDFINAIIKVPEAPETQGYAPTTMSDIKVGDPASMVQIMVPPVINNQGSANLNYHIETPQGRQGIQPDINLTYNSDGGKGFLGAGWNMSGLSSITTETRWGVPKYNPDIETETYLLDGQMLAFDSLGKTAHRYPGVKRTDIIVTDTAIFYLRKESSFKKIQRVGRFPTNYYWIITDKNTGTRYYYGGYEAFDASYVLRDESAASKNIAEWKLCRVVDVFGNWMSFKYEAKTFAVPGSATVKANALFIKEIAYTGWRSPADPINDTRTSKYRVAFESKSRVDVKNVALNARYGFLTGPADSLVSINVLSSADGPEKPIRSYKLYYNTGVFNTLLLDSIAQFGSGGKDFFYGQKFSYYNEAGNGSFYDAPVQWSSKSDGLKSDYSFPFISNTVTGIGGNQSSNSGHSIYFGLGTLGSPASKNMTLGVQFGSSSSSSNGISTLVDISGDGRPDKVFTKDGTIKYRKNNGSGFSDTVITIYAAGNKLRQFAEDESRTTSQGYQGHFGAFSLGTDNSKTESLTNTYFSDVNSDGLIDIVSNNVVYFNCGYKNGAATHTFDVFSSKTPVAISAQNGVSGFNYTVSKGRKDSLEKDNPLHDLVRVWEAPITGKVYIRAPLQQIKPSADDQKTKEYEQADGISASIQKGGAQAIASVTLAKDDYSIAFDKDYKDSVKKGQRIYFRLQSGTQSDANGAFDKVLWAPEISYIGIDSTELLTDVFSQNRYRYKLADDYLVSGNSGFSIDSGIARIDISGKLRKDKTLDTVMISLLQYKRVEILKPDASIDTIKYVIEDTIYKKQLPPDELYNNTLSVTNKSINAQDRLFRFQINGGANYNLKSVDWNPVVSYVRQYPKKCMNPSDGTISLCSPPEYINDPKQIYTTPYYVFSDSLSAEGNTWAAPDTAEYTFLSFLDLNDTLKHNDYTLLGTSKGLLFTIRDSNSMVTKTTIQYGAGDITTALAETKLTLNKGDKIVASYETTDTLLSGRADKAFAELKSGLSNIQLLLKGTEIAAKQSVTARSKANYSIRPEITFKNNHSKGYLYLKIFKNTSLVDSIRVVYDSNRVDIPKHTLSVSLNKGDVLYTAISTADSALIYSIQSAKYYCNQQVPAFYWTKRKEEKFGPMYRGWGQFIYNGMDNRGSNPINESYLVIETQQGATLKNNVEGTLNKLKNKDETANVEIPGMDGLSPVRAIFSMMSPYTDAAGQRWQGSAEDIFIAGDMMSASRLGLDNVKIENPFDVTINPATDKSFGYAVKKVVASKSSSKFVGAGPATLNGSSTESNLVADFMDLNGDRFPDIVSAGKIQFTTPLGGLEPAATNAQGMHESKSTSVGIGLGGGVYQAFGSFTLKTGSNSSAGKATAGNANATGTTINASVNIGASGSGNAGDEETLTTWLDVNGDGLPDKVYRNAVALNLGNGNFTSRMSYETGEITTGKNMSISPGVSLGVNVYKQSYSAGIGMSVSNTRPEFSLQDFNGDGLPDRVNINDQGVVTVEINDGFGFLAAQTFYDISIPATQLQSAAGATLPIEYLPSIPKIKSILGGPEIPNPLHDWINLDRTKFNGSIGKSFGGSFTFGFNAPIPFTPFIRFVFNPAINKSQGMNKAYRQLTDMDGDGFLDYVYATDETNIRVALSNLGKTNKLKTVTNPIGGSFTVNYEHAEPTSEHPGGKWVMNSLVINDGDSTDRINKNAGFDAKKEFAYSAGKYDRYEREFLGFGTITTKDLDFDGTVYRKKVQEYDTAGYYNAGNLLSDVLMDKDNNIFTKTINAYYLYILKPNKNNYARRIEVSAADITKTKFTGIAYTPLKKTESYNYEKSAVPVILNQSLYQYNTTGAITNYKYREGANISTSDFGYEAVIDYVNPAPGKYILDCPSSVKVKKGAAVFRETLCKYTKEGRPEKIYRRVNDTLFDTTTIRYNGFGNVEQRELQNGLSFTYEYDADKTNSYITRVNNNNYKFYSETWYNYSYGIPIRTKDINDKNINYELDDFGRVVRIVGPNECNNELKVCGNKYTIKIDYSLSGKLKAPKPVSLVTHFDVDNESDGIQTINFIDGFKRSVQIKKTAVLHDDKGVLNNKARWTVSGRTIYDAWGRIAQSYYPDIDSSENGLVFFPGVNAKAKPARMEYEPLDRVTKKILPDDNVEFTSAYILENNLSATQSTFYNAVNGGNQVRKTYTNGSGLKAADIVYNTKGVEVKTTYEYDDFHQLLATIDVDNNKTSYTYDLIGNKTKIEHPDAGSTVFKFDAASRLVQKITAKKDTICYDYDHARLTGVRYPRHPENNARYVYSNDIDNINGRNKLIFQEDASGAQAFEYGEMGEVTKVTRSILAPFSATKAYTFITSFDYDSWNRIQSITYPDNETVKYEYYKSGLLKQVTGIRNSNTDLPAKYKNFNYVARVGYDEFEQRVYLEYGNGTKTAYKYQAERRRLEQLNVTGISSQSPFFNAFASTYQYDNQNNITQNTILKTLPGVASPSAMEHNYAYDNQNRLDSAWGSWKDKTQTASYQLATDFDDLFNITGKRLTLKSNDKNRSSVTDNNAFEYKNGTPHQLSKLIANTNVNNNPDYTDANTEQYFYDANGNDTLKSVADKSGNDGVYQRKIQWDEENRIAAISMNGTVSSYVYDAYGNRTVKLSTDNIGVYVNGKFAANQTTPATYTLYANPYFSMRNGGGLYTKHIYTGTQRIVSQVENEGCFDDKTRIPSLAGIAAACPVDKNDSCKTIIGLLQRHTAIGKRINEDYDRFGLPHTVLAEDAFSVKPPINGTPDMVGPAEKNKTASETLPKAAGGPAVFNYYYHSNHIGSNSFITDSAARVVQYVEYLPFGETFMEQRQNYNSPFLFNGKEQDQETGLYYYGARYYDPYSYQWLSVDPMTEKYPGVSPYNFVFNNPLKFWDPKGTDPECILPKDIDVPIYNLYKCTPKSETEHSKNVLEAYGVLYSTAQVAFKSTQMDLPFKQRVLSSQAFEFVDNSLGTAGNVLSVATTGLDLYNNYKDMKNGEIGLGRAVFRSGTSLTSLGIGTYAASAGLAAGLSAPIAVMGYAKGLEMGYDILKDFIYQGHLYFNNMQNNIINNSFIMR